VSHFASIAKTSRRAARGRRRIWLALALALAASGRARGDEGAISADEYAAFEPDVAGYELAAYQTPQPADADEPMVDESTFGDPDAAMRGRDDGVPGALPPRDDLPRIDIPEPAPAEDFQYGPADDEPVLEPSPEGSAFTADAFGDRARPVTPVSWISGPYFKAGVNAPLGEDLLEGRQKTGYAIAGGYRQPLGPALWGDQLFFDLGLSYLSAFGHTTRSTAGRRVSALGTVTIVDNAFLSTLNEVRRAGVSAAVGWYWGEPEDVRGRDPQIRIATRLGGRAGSVRGRFLEFAPIPPPAGGSLTAIHGDTDVFGGVFAGAEAILLDRDYAIGHVEWTVDAELANDWIEFDGFDRGSLGTATVMCGFMLSR
jgi:hypothetical protein